MKDIKQTKNMFKLGSRGIAHFIAPLVIVLAVGVVGTYMLVASHANSPNSTAATAAKKKANLNASYIVLYSELGRYNSAKIQSSDPNTTLNCGAALSGANASVVKKLPVPKKNGPAKPLKVKCDAIGDNTQYSIFFGKNSKFGASYVAVDVDKGYCTLVHADPTQTVKLKLTATGGCPSAGTDAPKSRVDVALRVLPTLNKKHTAITGYVDLAVPNEDLTRPQCTGQVTITFSKDGQTQSFANPLKYTKGKGIQNGYCVATISQNKLNKKLSIKAGDVYQISATYTGSPFFNAATASASLTVPPKS